MPTYDFRCQNGHDSEHFFRKISDAPTEVRCEVCGAEAIRRVSGGAGLLFKGSGFYLTDYGKNAHRNSGDSAKSDGKTEGKAESKSEGATSGSSGTSSDAGGSGSASKAESTKPSESKASSTKSTGGDAK